MSTDNEEESLEGILKSIMTNHKDNEIDGVLVLIFEGDQASVYNSNIKPNIVEAIGALVGPRD